MSGFYEKKKSVRVDIIKKESTNSIKYDFYQSVNGSPVV